MVLRQVVDSLDRRAMAPTGPCRVCGAEGRNGKAPNKYCDQHIEEGILAKHIKSKRARPASPATSSASQTSLPDGWKLLSIETVVDCRHDPSAETRPCPSHTAASLTRKLSLHVLTVCWLSPRVVRCCTPDDLLDEVAAENGFDDEDMIAGAEYLVLGHFERRAGDRHGRHAMLWLSPADLQASPIAEEAVDEKLDEWERESARRRKEARRRVRADS